MDTQQARRLGTEAPLSSAEPEPPPAAEVPHHHAREVWRIAWPSVLTFALMTTNSILDRAFVGSLGRDALAGVGVGGQVMFLLVSVAMAIGVGATALVARFTGAREHEECTRATGQAAALAFWMGAAGMLLLYLVMGPLLTAMKLEPGAHAQGRAFLGMALLGTVPMFVGGTLASAFRGLGDTRTPLKVMVFANAVHIAGDIVLMLGNRPLLAAAQHLSPGGYGPLVQMVRPLVWSGLGVAGGGIAISASGFVSVALYVMHLRRSPVADAFSAQHLRLTSAWAMRVLRIGVPSGLAGFIRTTSGMGFTFILARTAERTAAVAALPIGMTAESIAFMPGLGFSVAASALVGQALGARRPERARRYGWVATWQGVGIMTLMGIVFYVGAEPFARVFTSDPTVIRIAVSYLRINAISEPMLGFGMILTGALQGAGDTMRPTVVTGITAWLVRIPLAWFLALGLAQNATGAWKAMAATTILGGLLSIMLWRDGKWQKVRV